MCTQFVTRVSPIQELAILDCVKCSMFIVNSSMYYTCNQWCSETGAGGSTLSKQIKYISSFSIHITLKVTNQF